MKKHPLFRWFLIAMAPLLIAASFSPGSYPLRYVSPETNAGVMTWQISLLVGCEIANGSASAQNYMFYDAQSVPADGFNTSCTATSTHPCMVGFVYQCPSKSTCYWNPPGPSDVNQGGMGIPMSLGIVWSNSSTFPAKTIGSRDSVVSCSYQNYGMQPALVSTPTPTAAAPTPTATPFPM